MDYNADFTLYLSGDGKWLFKAPELSRLKGVWECAITELALTPTFSPRSKRLYMCSDLLDESLVNNTKASILRNFEVGSRYKKYKSTEFVNLHYIKLRRGIGEQFSILFSDKKLNKVDIQTIDFYCAIHFKRK